MLNKLKTKVLVVDNNADLLAETSDILKMADYTVIEARTGSECLKIVETENPDLILLDVNLPDKNGLEVCKEIKSNFNNIILVMLISASQITSDAQAEGLEVGADSYIARPIGNRELLARVAAMVRIKKAEDSLHDTKIQLEKSNENLIKANQELKNYAYIASHDLKSPLRTVANYSMLLNRRAKDKLDDESKEFLEIIINASQRMQNIIDELLDYSNISNKENTNKLTDLNKIIKIVTTDLELPIEKSKATITSDVLPILHVEETKMIRLFENLLSNAIKYNDKKNPDIHISIKKQKNSWLFCVSDNGIGISKQHFEKIFVIFKRLHRRESYEGTGIGLAVCKKIIELYNGKIWVESEEGKGSSFYFTLPL